MPILESLPSAGDSGRRTAFGGAVLTKSFSPSKAQAIRSPTEHLGGHRRFVLLAPHDEASRLNSFVLPRPAVLSPAQIQFRVPVRPTSENSSRFMLDPQADSQAHLLGSLAANAPNALLRSRGTLSRLSTPSNTPQFRLPGSGCIRSYTGRGLRNIELALRFGPEFPLLCPKARVGPKFDANVRPSPLFRRKAGSQATRPGERKSCLWILEKVSLKHWIHEVFLPSTALSIRQSAFALTHCWV